jgi:hypothetical protein
MSALLDDATLLVVSCPNPADLWCCRLHLMCLQVDVGPSISQQGSPVPSEDVNAANGSMRGISPPLPHINTL